MAHLLPHSVALSSPTRPHKSSPHHSHSGNLLRLPLNGQRHLMRNPKLHEIQASHSSAFAHFCNAGDGEHHPPHDLAAATAGIPNGSGFHTNGKFCKYSQKQEQRWASDMDEYLAASRLCREEAMACSLQAAGVHWPFAERENRKKMKHKSLLLTCRALNVGTNKSWRGLKKLFSKQFMPFSNRDHHGLHHINTTISKRSSKALNVGGRKMDARIELGATKSEAMLGRKKTHGKENIEQDANAIREPSGIHAEKCGSKPSGWCENRTLQKGKLKKGGFKKKVRILLRKASGVALEVCDFLNLE